MSPKKGTIGPFLGIFNFVQNPVRLRSRRKMFSALEIPGPLRSPAGASSLATKAIALAQARVYP
ncbi:hypothetical protein [Pseudomonas sp. KK4]|uniref:hypothetical protein n=1 Tax=Pseudomonas sp. KK4 TaxID=1855729 RepID=UPI0011154BE3|nr:hypothetical protein [Pseudomonas sp. KK4]